MKKDTSCKKCAAVDAEGLALETKLRDLPNGEGDDLIAQMRERPRTFDCACGAHLELWDRGGDITCDRCHTPYNYFGQELRRDGASNPAWRNDDIDDLEGFELSQLAAEARRG